MKTCLLCGNQLATEWYKFLANDEQEYPTMLDYLCQPHVDYFGRWFGTRYIHVYSTKTGCRTTFFPAATVVSAYETHHTHYTSNTDIADWLCDTLVSAAKRKKAGRSTSYCEVEGCARFGTLQHEHYLCNIHAPMFVRRNGLVKFKTNYKPNSLYLYYVEYLARLKEEVEECTVAQ